MNKDQELIFTTIAQLRHELDEIFNPSLSVLNERVGEILDEIAELQEACEHDYTEQGICKICGKVHE